MVHRFADSNEPLGACLHETLVGTRVRTNVPLAEPRMLTLEGLVAGFPLPSSRYPYGNQTRHVTWSKQVNQPSK